MISLVAATALVFSSSAPAGLTRLEAQQIFTRLTETPTAKTSQRTHPLKIYTSKLEEVTPWSLDGVALYDGFLKNRGEPEVAWALARRLGSSVCSRVGGDSSLRTTLQIYGEAGYDICAPAAFWHRQTLQVQKITPDWEVAALALERLYTPNGHPPFESMVSNTATPTTGQVEHAWRYDDPAWAEWFVRETGQPMPQVKNRFGSGQCTSLAFAIRPDFPFDPRGGGRNDARNWIKIAKEKGLFVEKQPRFLSIGVQDGWGNNPAGHVFICLGETLDGRIRAIDCNFGRQPDGQVRVRTLTPDDKILGYIPVPREKRYEGVYAYPLRPNQATITADKPYWHAAFDGRVMFRSTWPESWWLSFRMRSLNQRQHSVKFWLAASSGTTEEVDMTVETNWETYEIGPLGWGGGGESIPSHTVNSLMMVYRSTSDLDTCEIADVRVIMRGP